MKALVVANWKMNPSSFTQARSLFDATKRAIDKAPGVSLVVAPPSIYLRELSARYRGKKIVFAGQDAHWEASGAHTGEISLSQLKDAKASWVIIGHSERRAEGETDEDVRKKVAAAIAAKFTPIVCVGERVRDHSGTHFTFVKEQLRAAFADVPPEKASRIIVAYEPVWTIGGEVSMNPQDMHEMAIFIRKSLVASHGQSAMNAKIIYGGATTEENAAAMLIGGDVAGLLIGHVSVDQTRFAALLSAVSRA